MFHARWSACAESCVKTWTRLDLSVPKCASDHPVIDEPTRAPARPALEDHTAQPSASDHTAQHSTSDHTAQPSTSDHTDNLF